MPDNDDREVIEVIGADVYNFEITGDIAATLTANSGGTNTAGPKVIVVYRNARTTDQTDADLAVVCRRCNERGVFGYRNQAGGMDWYCDDHA